MTTITDKLGFLQKSGEKGRTMPRMELWQVFKLRDVYHMYRGRIDTGGEGIDAAG